MCEEGPGICAHLLTIFSVLLIIMTLPFSLCLVVQVVQVRCPYIGDYSFSGGFVQEYERTVIFRLGRLLSGGARGTGVFFIIPCIDIYGKIDLRVRNFNVPPQEVRQQNVKVC